MRSTPFKNLPNMRGKKTYRFPCACGCEARDFREQEFRREDGRLIRRALRGLMTMDHLHQAEIDAA